MILDSLAHAYMYFPLGHRFQRGFDFLASEDLVNLTPGRYDIGGPDVYAMVQEYQTRSVEKSVWESHRVHADIQYIITGTERMGYAPLSYMTVTRPYVASEDVQFLEGKGDIVTVHAGNFALFMPQDVHMPMLSAGDPAHVKKVVIKVNLS